MGRVQFFKVKIDIYGTIGDRRLILFPIPPFSAPRSSILSLSDLYNNWVSQNWVLRLKNGSKWPKSVKNYNISIFMELLEIEGPFFFLYPLFCP